MDLLTACLFFPYKREQEVHKCIHPNISELAALTLKCRDKRNFPNIAADTVALLEIANKFSQSLGYNIGQVETLLGCINRYCVF